MRLIVDIPEKIYNTIDDDMYVSKGQLDVLQRCIREGVYVPDNVTHGEAMQIGLKALFPKTIFLYRRNTTEGYRTLTFSDEWWNAKYPVYEESEE